MKIDETYRDLGILSGSTESLQKKRAEAQENPLAATEKDSGGGTAVNISNASLEFSKAAEMMERESPERAERIREIQRKIQEGIYQVDSGKVAEKILTEEWLG